MLCTWLLDVLDFLSNSHVIHIEIRNGRGHCSFVPLHGGDFDEAKFYDGIVVLALGAVQL